MRDAQKRDLDSSLNLNRPQVEWQAQDVFYALRFLAEEKKQSRVTHTYRVVMRFGLPIRKRAVVDSLLLVKCIRH